MLLVGALLFLVVLAVALVAAYLLGFRLGGDRWLEEIVRVRAEAARARQEMNRLTRQAVLSMADELARRRS